MFITTDFVYIHIPKTGGTFVRSALQRWCQVTGRVYIDTASDLGRASLGMRDQHGTVHELPQTHKAKPILFSIRNPFEYYVSLFAFGWWRHHPEDEFDVQRISSRFPSYPYLSFSAFVEAINDWRLWPEPDRELGQFTEEHGIGLLTWKLITMLAPEPTAVFADLAAFLERPFESELFTELHALRTSTLGSDLIEFLTGLGAPAEEITFINDLGRIYPTEGGRSPEDDWHHYYNSRLAAFVRNAERAVLTRWREFEG